MSNADKKCWLKRHYEPNVRKYFPFCPLCGSNELNAEFALLGRDFLSCKKCGARWHLYIGITGLKWAKLKVPAKEGYGQSLLRKKILSKYWKILCKSFKLSKYDDLRALKILEDAKREEKIREVKKKIKKLREKIKDERIDKEEIKEAQKRIKELKEKIEDARIDLENARYKLDRALYDNDTNELESASRDMECAQEELESCEEELEKEIKKLKKSEDMERVRKELEKEIKKLKKLLKQN
ncbi:MAG: hypothetical protein QXQ64_06695 [Candidatus Bathyarchaeia archaeon]